MTESGRISFIILLFYLLSAIIGGQAYWYTSYKEQNEENQVQLSRFTSQLSSQLDKYAYIPQLLSKDSELIDALTNPQNSGQIDITNRYLHDVNQIIRASDTYLLDRDANTIAASNWNSSQTFIGRNFAFRPYFQQALSGSQGQYFALGSTSGKRGFYYSYPVMHGADVLGIVVVKTNLSDIESNWSSTNSYLIASDADGVVFMSSNPAWLFKSLFPMAQDKKNEIRDGQRYLDTEISSLNFLSDHPSPTGELSRAKPILFSGQYLSARKHMATQELDIRVLAPKVLIFWDLLAFLIIISLVYSLIYVSWLLIRNRQVKQRQITKIQMEAQKRLEFQVMERTAELQMEVDEREKTELMLRQTQEELIQAAKLAVLGQMSAGISHELNNPLAAIRSFAENGKRFLDKGQPERTIDNLTRISALTERMAKISQQLKSLARKTSSDELVYAHIQPIIISALELLKPQLRATQIRLTTHFCDNKPQTRVNVVQLEQVLINLLTNVIDELSHAEERQLTVTLCETEQYILIHVDDSGRGLPASCETQLFEPFFTTKKNGLGLGLSISSQIMQAMNGGLSTSTSPLGGARFTISLVREETGQSTDTNV